jgi:hypothetical protein
MKATKTFLLLAFVCAAVAVYAQEEKQKNNSVEFGIIGFDLGIIRTPSQPFAYANDQNLYGVANGLIIKKHTEKKSYRLMVHYKTTPVAYKARGFKAADSLNATGDYSRATVSIGGERIFFKRNFIQFYWGVDLSLLIGKYTAAMESINNSAYGYSASTFEHGAGLGALIGMRFTLKDRIRLSFEPRYTSFFSQLTEVKRALTSAHEISREKAFSFDNTPQLFVMVSYLF